MDLKKLQIKKQTNWKWNAINNFDELERKLIFDESDWAKNIVIAHRRLILMTQFD
jgi:hypothetical protein